MLKELVGPLSDKAIRFTWSDDVPELLAKQSAGGTRGARDLRNAVRRQVEDKIAEMIVGNPSQKLTSIHLTVEDERIILNPAIL